MAGKGKLFLFNAIVLLLLFSLLASAAKLEVNGDVKKYNDRAKIAIDPSSGIALVVWSNGKATANDKGAIYAREIIPADKGGFKLGELFMVSDKKGSNQHPEVAWLPLAGKFLIVWDTSFRDLNEYYKYDHILDRPLPDAKILARTYIPSSGVSVSEASDRLGPIETVSDPDFELNILPHISVYGAAQAPAAKEQDVFIFFLGSDEERNGNPGPFVAGAWGARYLVSSKKATSPPASDMALQNKKLMLNGFDFNSQRGLAVFVSSFVMDDMIYAGGAHMKFNFQGSLFFPSGVGGIYRIDPDNLSIPGFVALGETIPENGEAPLQANGQIAVFGDSSTAPAETFTIIGTSNIENDLITIGSDLNTASMNNHGVISKNPGEIVDQFLFKLGDTGPGPAAKKSEIRVLYHTKDGAFRYRALDTNGKPKGGSKKAFATKKNRLLYMDLDVAGNDVVVAWTERKNKKRTLIYFDSFTAK